MLNKKTHRESGAFFIWKPSEIKKSSVRRISGEPSKGPGMNPIEKPASGIPKAVLQEPELFHQETLEGGFQLLKLFIGAADSNQQRFPAVQRQQTHERGGIHLKMAVAHGDPLTFPGGIVHKILHILQAGEANIELVHFFIPPALYKIYFIVYNGGQIPNRPDTQYYSTFL